MFGFNEMFIDFVKNLIGFDSIWMKVGCYLDSNQVSISLIGL